MIESTCNDYAEFVDIDLNTKLQPLNQSVDDMLTRLEEFETMVLLIQQERCNAIGLTGSLPDCIDIQPQLQILCQRIDTLENLSEYLTTYVNTLETKICMMEEKLGFAENANMFTSFLKSSLFKKVPDTKQTRKSSSMNVDPSSVSIKQFFITEENSDTTIE